MSRGYDPVDLLVRASARFGEQVTRVRGDDWDRPTPCTEWDVRALVTHVVLGDAGMRELVEGGVVSEVELDVSALGSNPMAVWRGTALGVIEVARSTPLDRVMHHRGGDLPFEQVLGFRTSDNLVHAWDLSVALGSPDPIPDDLASWALEFWQPLVEGLLGSGHFAPVREPVDDTPGSRLLALLGREA